MKVTSLRYRDAKFHHPSLGASPPRGKSICLPPELSLLLKRRSVNKFTHRYSILWPLIMYTDGWLKILCVLQVDLLSKFKRPAQFQHRSSVHHAVMRICICHMLSIICTKNVFLGVYGEDMKILCSNPQKALPCVNARLLVYRSRDKIGSTAWALGP